jgi:hypothetical protein
MTEPGKTGPRVRDATKEEADLVAADSKAQQELGSHLIQQAEKYQTLFTAVYGIYTGLLLLFGLMNGEILKMVVWPAVFWYLLPIVSWIIGICLFFLVLRPDIKQMPPYSPTAIQRRLVASNVKKARYYSAGLIAFGVGVLLMVVPIVAGSYYASLPPAQETGDVQFLIYDDSVQYISEIPIELVSGTNRTVTVALFNTTDTVYSVRLSNGDTVDLDKKWIRTVIRKAVQTDGDSEEVPETTGTAIPQ